VLEVIQEEDALDWLTIMRLPVVLNAEISYTHVTRVSTLHQQAVNVISSNITSILTEQLEINAHK